MYLNDERGFGCLQEGLGTLKDYYFLYQKYVRHRRRLDGLFWDLDAPFIDHNEQFLEDIILKNAIGKVLVDAGANAGAWAIRASRSYQAIYAFEPNPVFFRSLVRNIRMNHAWNVNPVQKALGDWDGKSVHNVLINKPFKPFLPFAVDTVQLDPMNLDVSVLKIDVEGAGYQVVKGALKTIERSKPIIIMEVHTAVELEIPSLIPSYHWSKRYREMEEDWIVKENGKQVFLIGTNPMPGARR